MSETPDTPETPANDPQPPDDAQASRIGIDSWVAESEGRRSQSLIARASVATPNWLKLAVFCAFAASCPYWMSEGDLFIFGLFTLLYIALGLGLNTVVGFAGLLDLGYVAFYGIGAYTYALLSSSQYGIHWPAEATIPIAMAAAAIVGVGLGFSARRLLGDYLAIVTLFFAQAFVFFTGVSNPTVAGKGLTGGADGIAQLDPLTFFGYKLTTTKQLYFFLLIVVALLAIALHFANQSRTGRAWRALRDDPLAAEVMSIPVNRMKILAFVFGAAVAGLCGAVYAAIETAVISTNFSVSVLIVIYAVIILGGLGTIAGVFVGAVIINCTFEFLQPQNDHPNVKHWLFYLTLLMLIAVLRPWYRSLVVLVGTIALGFVVHAIVAAEAASSWTAGTSASRWLKHWAVIPTGDHGNFDNYIYIGLVLAVVCTAMLKGWWRTIAMIPTIYLAALAWENVLAGNGGITAFIIFGAMLIALMTIRPQGLLGKPQVEVV